MVYLIDIINRLKEQILQRDNLDTLAYLYLSNSKKLKNYTIERFAGAEEVAACGYKEIQLEEERINREIQRSPIKGISFADNVFKLMGFQLASGRSLYSQVEKKFATTSLKNKYFISKFETGFTEQLKDHVTDSTPLEIVISRILGFPLPIEKVQKAIHDISLEADDVIDLIILEDFHKQELASQIIEKRYVDKDARSLIIGILNEFSNGVVKISKDRRKGHPEFLIEDEYDVQDLLYLILKTIFPTLKEEDPTPRVGHKSNRIDLILREEGILIEVKMIKEKDSNEKKFVEELKVDIQSYYECKWLKHLICFVYDPYGKTRDKQNFYDLNGTQTIKGVTFYVDVILSGLHK